LTNSQRIAAASGAALVLAVAVGWFHIVNDDSVLTLKAEKQTVQAAFDAMVADQHVDLSRLTGCEANTSHTQPATTDRNWTDQMTAFPPGGAVYAATNQNGIGRVTVLATHYLREAVTPSARYICDQEGNIYQLAK
jgi:hypothetical protein